MKRDKILTEPSLTKKTKTVFRDKAGRFVKKEDATAPGVIVQLKRDYGDRQDDKDTNDNENRNG